MHAREFLAQLFQDGSELLGQGLRGAELRAAFVERASVDALAVVEATGQLVADSLARLGLSDWPGARLGQQFADHRRLGDSDAAESLAAALLYPASSSSVDGADWLAGNLFSTRRLDGYLRAAERDPKQGVGIMTLNIRNEIQRLRRQADPVGSALYDNLKGAGELLVEDARAESISGAKLAFGTSALSLELPSEYPAIFETARGFESLDTAVRRDQETSDLMQGDGTPTRHSPLRSAQIRQEMSGGILAVAKDSCPVEPLQGTLHLGVLSNGLRGRYPTPASFAVGAMPVDAENNAIQIVDKTALDPATLLSQGPSPLIALFARAREGLREESRLSSSRREKLAEILDRMEVAVLDAAGDLPSNSSASIREMMGIKPQTWSDDLKVINRLIECASSSAGRGV